MKHQKLAMGAAIAGARDRCNLSQRDLAVRLKHFGLPLAHSAIANIEKGKRRLDPAELFVIAAALSTSPDVLALPDASTLKDADDGVLDAIPEEDEPLELTDTWAVKPAMARPFWQGAWLPPILLSREPRLSWPVPDELHPSGPGWKVDLRERWFASRPLSERALEDNCRRHSGLRDLLKHADTIREVASQPEESISARDRLKVLQAIYGLRDASKDWIQSDPGFRGGDDALAEAADNENRAAWDGFSRLFDELEATGNVPEGWERTWPSEDEANGNRDGDDT